ncbi:aladin [Populus alba]|uniref:aladin n=1 Tax=Populus alba TaxID=43335 RepID=UPI00158DE0CD|nr:aladin [Populus alba]
MPSFPLQGSVTICEINRTLIVADAISDDRAKDAYGKILGMVFSPVPFQPEQLGSTGENQESEHQERNNGESVERKGLMKSLQYLVNDSIKRMFYPNCVHLLPEIDLQGVSWHQHRHIIAFISGPNQVIVRDYEDSEGKDACVLSNGAQQDIRALEWRPNGGKSLSVACKGGICIWAASYPGNPATVRSGAASSLGTLTRGSGGRWTLVDFLRSHSDEQTSAISWSPDGRYLASASCESSSFTIWDVSQGLGTPIRRGLGGISLLKWSPTGDYFFAAKFDGTFYLWETNTWTSEPWSSTSGFVTGATWDPDGHIILIAFSGSLTLGSIHFSSKPPSLDAHLLPVDLLEITTMTGSEGIEKIAWDASGERLAVSYKGGDDNYKGLVAIYDVRRTPLISASLVGFIRGPGENPKPIAFSFHDKFKQGPLLSVCWSSGFCCTYPLIFHSHSLP